MNFTEYTGEAYDFRTYNCWHHVMKVRSDAGFTTPDFNVTTPGEINAGFDSGRKSPQGLNRVTNLMDYDIVLMGAKYRGRLVWHAGVYCSGYVSHCNLEAGQVILEPIAAIKDKYGEVELWRG